MNYELQITNKFLKISILCMILYSLFMIPKIDAASIYFDRPVDSIHQDDIFEIILKFDSEKESINAAEGKISFSDNLILRNINDGNSFLTLWIERPILKDDSVVFAGVVPGGYLGELGPYWSGYRAGSIFTLIFEATEMGQSWLKVKDITILLNDGEGMQIIPKIENMQFSVAETKGGRTILKEADLYSDNELPEVFIPQIAHDKNIFDGKYFLIFETQDKGSGIFYYEVKEGKREFIVAESPYLLKDQTLKSFIQIKAVDRSGNARIVEIAPTYPPTVYKNYAFWIIIILTIVIGYIFSRKKRK